MRAVHSTQSNFPGHYDQSLPVMLAPTSHASKYVPLHQYATVYTIQARKATAIEEAYQSIAELTMSGRRYQTLKVTISRTGGASRVRDMSSIKDRMQVS